MRSFTLKRYTLLTISISLNKEIISPYSCYIKKGLIYIIIISPFNRQPSLCSEYTKANIYLLYNMRSVPLNKNFYYYIYLYTHYSLLIL